MTAAAALTPRQRQILRHVAHGHRSQDIADTIGVSLATVKFHLRAVHRRLGTTTNARR